MKIISLFAIAVSTSVLVACGGGGTEATTGSLPAVSTAAPAVTLPILNTNPIPATQTAYIDKYIGTWTTACLTTDGVSESGRFVITISKKSDTNLASAVTALRFAGITCTGAILPNIFPGGVADITYVDTVNNVDRFSNANNGKSTLKITGLVLNVGNEVNLDGAGYPIINFIDPASAFIKN